ncbi:hypothetical protein DH2020_047384 [Rehmannia glutinosa]|uniref:AB hydrolase-1 domain-containing protein n=1 Tax=Rehmannia glutinosa TaxID=99300 RepID=A0ABR0U9E8_REHGL
MSIHLRRLSKSSSKLLSKMAEEINSSSTATAAATAERRSLWPSVLRWIPTSTDHIIAAEKRLLSLLRTPYHQEQVNIGSGPPGSKTRWFRSGSDEPRFINTVTFDSKEGVTDASDGSWIWCLSRLLFPWGGSSRPDFTCKSTEETENWFIDSFEEWRKAKNLSNFILLGHSFGGYVAAKYALKHPEHIQQLILVGPAGFSSETEHMSERLTQFRATWKGVILNHLWESNFTPQKIISASDWKVPTTFIYGVQDWMNYQGAQEARTHMKVPCEIIRVPQGGHFIFIDNPTAFHSAVFYACRKFFSADQGSNSLPEGLESV